MTVRAKSGLSACLAVLLALPIWALSAAPATAHPHVWIDMTTALQFDDQGRLSAIEIRWTFDEFYSAFAVEGSEKKDGAYSDELLAGLTEVNLENLDEWNYFTEVAANDSAVKTGKARDGKSTWDDKNGRLTLAFTVPLEEPLAATPASPIKLRVYDPSYYISIDYVKKNPVSMKGGPHDGCTVTTEIPDVENVWTALPESAFTDASGKLGAYFATVVALTCAPKA